MDHRINSTNPNGIRVVCNLSRRATARKKSGRFGQDVVVGDGGGLVGDVETGPVTGLLLARKRNVAATATAATTIALIR